MRHPPSIRDRVVALVAILAIAASLASLPPLTLQPFETLSHLRAHMVAGLLALGLVAAVMRQRRSWIALWGTALTLSLSLLAAITPTAPEPARKGASTPAPTVLIWANLQTKDDALEAVADLAALHAADIVALTELPAWSPLRFDDLFAHLPCHTGPTDGSPFAVTLLTRPPCGEEHAFDGVLPEASLNVQTPDGLSATAVHPPHALPVGLFLTADGPVWTVHLGSQRVRNHVIERAFAHARGDPRAVVFGDFNATPWSRAMTGARRAGLRLAPCRAARWPGLAAGTWPEPLSAIGLPIDLVYVGDALSAACRIGPDIGSDHRPLIVTIAPDARL